MVLNADSSDCYRQIRIILEKLGHSIRQLAAPLPAQYEVFSEFQREQITRDVGSLQARLDEIPAEIEREQVALRARYADPKPHLFPVGVSFLVPVRYDR